MVGLVIITAILLYVMLTVPYILKFGCFSFNCLSSDNDDWGQFGDYIGGLLNPALASITLAVISFTSLKQLLFIKEQNSALEKDKKEKDVEERTRSLEQIVKLMSVEFERVCYVPDRGYVSVRAAFSKMFTLDDVNGPKVNEIITNIHKSSGLLIVHSLMLEQIVEELKENMLGKHRISLLSSLFQSPSEIGGFVQYLLSEGSKLPYLLNNPFSSTVSNLSAIVSFADKEVHEKLVALVREKFPKLN